MVARPAPSLTPGGRAQIDYNISASSITAKIFVAHALMRAASTLVSTPGVSTFFRLGQDQLVAPAVLPPVFGRLKPALGRLLEFLHFRLHEVMIWFVSGHGFSRAEP